jgi:excisionase family DNA binding protein
MERLLTVNELSKLLGIAPGSVYHWLSAGRLPCIRFSARCVRFRESDIAKLVDELGSGSPDSEALRAPGQHQPNRSLKNKH